jgi:hypothetical protein
MAQHLKRAPRFLLLAGALAGALAAALAAPGAAEATPPVVVFVYPPPQRVNVPANTIIEVTFDQAIDHATFDAISFRVFGRWSGPATGTITFDGTTAIFTPTEPFFAGEWVTVSVSRAVENVFGEPLAKGYAFNFWIKTVGTLLNLTYTGRVTTRQGNETWVQSYGAYAGDLDNDGWSDLLVPNERTDDARVFMNNAGSYSTFVVESLPGGDTPSPNEGADFDNDGEIDVVIGNTQNDQVSVLFGDGTGDFPVKTAYTVVSGTTNSVRGVGVLDLNGDGWDDIVAANRYYDAASTGNLSVLLNNGDGTFAAAVAEETGSNGEWGIAIADANNDGLLDVFCSHRSSPYNVVVMLSDGEGGLTPQPPVAAGGYLWQLAAGDFNDDGDVDLAGCSYGNGKMVVLRGNGAGGFTGPPLQINTGGGPLAIDTGDVDGDGDLELVTSNYGSGTWTLFENRLGSFVNPHTLNASSAGSCAVLHDRDNDGDMDLTGIDEMDDWLYFYENDPPVTGVHPTPEPPAVLLQNHPNPFNPSTVIRFELSVASAVDLSVFSPTGAFVTRLSGGERGPGVYDARWDGTDARGERVSSGVYFYRLVAGGATLTRKMVLLK